MKMVNRTETNIDTDRDVRRELTKAAKGCNGP